MASIGSEPAPRSLWRTSWRADIGGAIERVRALFADGSDNSLARRLAGAAYLIRVVSALIAFISQILLARWMGRFEFGIYIYAWTWVLLLGGMVDLGLGSATQRFIPEYTEHKQFALLRGFLLGSRWLAAIIATAIASVGAIAVTILAPHLDAETIVPLYISCAALPMFGLGQVLSGVARSYDWVNLGLMPTYVLRQLVLLALIGVAYALGLPTDAVTATLIGIVALWSVTIGQAVVLNRRLSSKVDAGPKAYAVPTWLATAAPIFVVEAFYLLLTYSDVIVVKQFRPPGEVAIYYAAAKTLALVAFIYFSVGQTIAHKFAEHHVAGDRKRLAEFLRLSVRLTFWPSLAMIAVFLALGQPLLRLFGPDFVSGYYLMFILAVGLLARASVGPAERLLNMLGERRSCALVYAGAFAIDLVLCIALLPPLGIAGAAIANAVALVVRIGQPVPGRQIPPGPALLHFRRPQGSVRPIVTVNASTDLAFASEAAAAIAGMRRAALADRQAANALATEWRPLEQLEAIAEEWRGLAERALEPNVFYEPSFALPAARVFGRDAGAVLVWSQTQPRRLLGFFPARIERRRYGFTLPVLVGLTHPYGPLGVPLVEREAAEPVIAAWLDASRRRRGAAGISAVALPARGRRGRNRARDDCQAGADADGRFQSPAPGAAGAERRAVALHRASHRRAPTKRTPPAMAPLERDRRRAAHRGDGAACGRRRARRFPGAGGRRLERPSRYGHGRSGRSAPLPAHRGGRARGGRQGFNQPHPARRPRHCRHDHLTQRARRLVLEDRL